MSDTLSFLSSEFFSVTLTLKTVIYTDGTRVKFTRFSSILSSSSLVRCLYSSSFLPIPPDLIISALVDDRPYCL